MLNVAPIEPGYYWAKLKTPSGGRTYNDGRRIDIQPEEGWVSNDWEIVEVCTNIVNWREDVDNPERFYVNVFGIPVTQWILDFYWGPKVSDAAPNR